MKDEYIIYRFIRTILISYINYLFLVKKNVFLNVINLQLLVKYIIYFYGKQR